MLWFWRLSLTIGMKTWSPKKSFPKQVRKHDWQRNRQWIKCLYGWASHWWRMAEKLNTKRKNKQEVARRWNQDWWMVRHVHILSSFQNLALWITCSSKPTNTARKKTSLFSLNQKQPPFYLNCLFMFRFLCLGVHAETAPTAKKF